MLWQIHFCGNNVSLWHSVVNDFVQHAFSVFRVLPCTFSIHHVLMVTLQQVNRL